MVFYIIMFMLGDCTLQRFAELPNQMSMIIIFIISFIFSLVLFLFNKRYTFLLIAFMLGFTWTAWYANSVLLSWQLDKKLEGKPMLVTGYIASIPIGNSSQSFLFSLENSNAMIKLSSFFVDPTLRVGDKRQFLVRLKRIHGQQSPGAFDFEAWGLQNRIRASGYIVPNIQNKLLSHHWYWHPINQMRQTLLAKIQLYSPKSDTAKWLAVLMVGERINISPADWQVLRKTGTNHLMAIAGLHIGVIALLMHFLTIRLWRRWSYLCLILGAQQAGACFALLAAFIYSAFAGFSLPTQRACIMLTVFIINFNLKRTINIWYSWSSALFIVLLLNPLSVLTESFWLSFATLALIIYGMHGRLFPNGLWWKWGRVQWLIGIGLIPLTLILFQQCSFISFVANTIAIPWLSFTILPFCLLASFFIFVAPTIAASLLSIADKSLSILWLLLSTFAKYEHSNWLHAMPNQFVLAVTLIAFIFILFPNGLPGRWFALIWLLPFLFYQPEKPASGNIWLSILDVGQGLSVVVQTKSHVLVYDTGPKYRTGFDMGDNIVVPYLVNQSINKIDKLIISHGDNDHIGGAESLLYTFPTNDIKSSILAKSFHTTLCIAGDHWVWDDVKFTILYPTPEKLHLGNDSSCVVKIDNGHESVLLTGDIEKQAEKYLLARDRNLLKSTIVIAPHHGSNSSAMPTFIEAMHPKWVFYSTGYRNRYHFPNQHVVKRYAKANAKQFNTAETGTIQIKLRDKNDEINLYRSTHQHYWFDDPHQ